MNTIYGQQWLISAIDEAHNVRNLNHAYFASISLRMQSQFIVAMTATPVNTKLQVRIEILRVVLIYFDTYFRIFGTWGVC